MKAIDYVTLGRRLQMAHETACQPVCRKYDLNTTSKDEKRPSL